MRDTYLEINLKEVSENIKKIKAYTKGKTEIAPVLKADAYGEGAEQFKKILEENDIKTIAVAITDEAITLRKEGFNQKILILNELLESDLEDIIQYDLTPRISVYEMAEKLNELANQANKTINIHIEIDTGMGRTGIKPSDAEEYANKIKQLKNLKIEGIFTHFASADTNPEYTDLQIRIFNDTVKKLEKQGLKFKYIHSSASSGILNCLDRTKGNLIRPGITIYGYMPSEDTPNKIGVNPTAVLKSKVVFIKEVPAGTSISYGGKYITPRESKIATIPIGYADGIRRSLSNKGRVYINGKYAPIVGNVCMDDFMVDVTDIPNIKVGDEVIIWDNKNIKLEEIATLCDTINYEILCTIGKRVARKYLK